MSSYESKVIDGEILRSILISGANNLFNHYPEVDSLNVFPVPDGDTGTNMNLTITSGAKEIMNIRNEPIGEVSKVFSRGLLMGARGNSGVILSRIFQGFSSRLSGQSSVDIKGFAEAWQKGSETAYKGIAHPVEGTILTVVRESSTHLVESLGQMRCIGDAMECLLAEAKRSLQRTPELLPVLKEVGVVDSGGAGLVRIMEGMLVGLRGEIIERKQISMPQSSESAAAQSASTTAVAYFTSFVLNLKHTRDKKEYDHNRFTALLQSLGSDFKMSRDGDSISVTMNTPKPGVVINYAQLYGEFDHLQVSTSPIQDVAPVKPTPVLAQPAPAPKERHKYAVISVSVGAGLEDMFKSLRVDYIVSGGQTMNPSTEDFVKAVETVNAEHVYILPNNKNIIMAAQQASSLCEDCDVHVIPTRTILEGLSSCMMFNPDVEPDENEQEMIDAATRVSSGQVTFAIKDTQIDDMKIKKDYYMGIVGTKKIVACEKDLDDVCMQLLKYMITKESSIVTIVYGDNVTAEAAQALTNRITKEYKIEVDLHYGGQPVYSYFFGVE